MNNSGLTKLFTKAVHLAQERSFLITVFAPPCIPAGIGLINAGLPVAGALVLAGSFGSLAGVAIGAYSKTYKEQKDKDDGPDVGQP